MIDFRKKIILFIFIVLMALPPFFSGGNGALISSAALIFIGLAFLLFGFLDKIDKRGYGGNFFLSPFFFLFLFLIFSLITVFFSISPYNSFAGWLQYLSYGVLFFIAANLKIERKEIDFLIKIFLAVSGALSLIGMYFYLTGSYVRLTSTFYWPNPFAGYLLFSLPLALYWFLKRGKGLKKKALPGFVLILIFTAFVLTGSRGAFLSLLLVLPVFFYFYKKSPNPPSASSGQALYQGDIKNEKSPQPPFTKGGSNIFIKRARKFFVDILLIIILSAVLITGINFLKQDGFRFAAHAKKSFTESDFSANIRLNYWQGAWEIFKDYPVFGSGLGTFQTIYPQYQKDPISAGKYAHNLYLEMLSEAGVFILILFIAFLASVYRIKFKGLIEKEYAIPLYVGTLAFLIHNGVDVGWHFGANTLVFWIFLGLLYNITKNKREEHNQKRFRGLIVFISALLIISGIMFLYGGYYFSEGMRLQSKGELVLAENAFGKSILLSPNPKYLRQYGIILYSRGINYSQEREKTLNKALAISSKAAGLDAYNSLNYELSGKIYYALGRIEEAEREFRYAIKLQKYYPRHYINLAALLIEQGRTQEARNVINEAFSYYPEDVVRNRKINIMQNQAITSGIEKEINYLKYLLSTL